MNKLLIGFSGHIGSGKNYVAEHLFIPSLLNILQTKNKIPIPYYFSFGDHMKVECLCRFSYSKLSQNDGYNNFFVNKNQETRKMLQKYGTENGRNVYHEDIWVRAVNSWIDIQMNRVKYLGDKYLPIFIISDVRFVNEADFITSHNGIIIRINAPKRSCAKLLQETKGDLDIIKKIQSHRSETSLDKYPFKYIIKNDYDDNVEEQINKLTLEYLISIHIN